jgi:hypothetical protein
VTARKRFSRSDAWARKAGTGRAQKERGKGSGNEKEQESVIPGHST